MTLLFLPGRRTTRTPLSNSLLTSPGVQLQSLALLGQTRCLVGSAGTLAGWNNSDNW
jgi:hypothetical protein